MHALARTLRGAAFGLVVVTNAAPAVASTYQVTPDGDDDGDGSAAAPWQTLQRAADAVAPGDTVEVAAGDYRGMALEASGTADAPITFIAADGAVVTSDNAVTPDGINLEGASFVVIDGFTVTGASRAGIRTVLGDHVTLRNNRLDQNGRWGIITGFSDDLLIEGNEASRSADEHGIYVSNSGDRPVVRGNIMWGNAANGLHMNGDVSAGGDGVISGAIVERNIVFDNGMIGGAGINCDGVQGAVISNNLIYDNHSAGISLYRIDGGGPSANNLVINNTVVMPDGSRWGITIQDDATGTIVRNNILLHENGVRGAMEVCDGCVDGLVADHNAVTGRFAIGEEIVPLADWQAATGQDGDARLADATLFIARADGDFHLAGGAIAIDAGSSDGAPGVDLAGNGRPQGAAVDIGAFEDCGELACASPVCVGDACAGGDGSGDDDGARDSVGGCCQGSPGGSASGLPLALLTIIGLRVGRRASAA